MAKLLRLTGLIPLLALMPQTGFAQNPDLTERLQTLEEQQRQLQEEIQRLRQELVTRPEPSAPPTPRTAAAPPAANAFNPAISVIFDGAYYNDGIRGDGATRLEEAAGIHSTGGHDHDHDHADDGHGHGHSHGTLERGFNLRPTEIVLQGTVDPYVDLVGHLVVEEGEGLELEELYFRTRSLPAGLTLKGGKFLSGIGYINSQHPHEWDFVEATLPYQTFFGAHGLLDTGLQLTWLPDWPVYTRLGVEAFQGENERMSNLLGVEEGFSEKDAPRLWSAFIKVSPELGYDHALQGGLFGVFSRQHQRLLERDAVQEPLDGEAWVLGTDWVYKYDPGGIQGQGSLTLQGEYLYQVLDLEVDRGEAAGAERRFVEDGFYVQGTYGFAPRWNVGLRYDAVGINRNRLESAGQRLLAWEQTDRVSLALTWNPTEFARLRAQWSRADVAVDGGREDFNQFFLQGILSLGSHGAHNF